MDSRIQALTDMALLHEQGLPGGFNFDVGLMDAMYSGWYQPQYLYPNFSVTPADTVVDIGCGEGGNLMYCANQGAHVIAADIDAQKVEATVQRLKTTKARQVEGIIGDSNPLNIPDETATKIICTEVIEHVDDPTQFLSELVRIGKKGAQYLLTVPDPAAEKLQKACGAPDIYFQKPNHIRVIEREEFGRLVEGAGLVIDHRSGYGFFWTIWWAFYWHCTSNNLVTTDALAINWSKTWLMAIRQPKFATLHQQLNELAPKAQVIIAHKPA